LVLIFNNYLKQTILNPIRIFFVRKENFWLESLVWLGSVQFFSMY